MNYYKCDTTPGETCKNPFYHASTWENVEYLYSGEYGTKLGFLYNSVWYVVIILFILAFISNHLIYNKIKKILPENEVLKHEIGT
jgi:hypothetical protein